MTAALPYVLFASAVVVIVFISKTLPWRPLSQGWPPVYGRTFSISISLLFLGYALYGLLVNDIVLPGKAPSPLIHLHGWCAWAFFLAAVCLALFFTSAMGGRSPGYRLQLFRRIMFACGWGFFLLSLMGWLYGKATE